jgi:predicted dehydrogenase
MIRVGVVGLGWWGQHILKSIQVRSTELTVIAAADPRTSALDAVDSDLRVPVSPSLDDLLNNADIDAIILATPHSLHEEQIIRVAKARKHVFCEKPLALTKDSAERAIYACETANVILGVGHMRRFEPAMVEIKQLIDSGELGTLMHVEANFSHDLLGDVDPADWRASELESPIPALSAMAIHLTDAYLHLFGPISEVFANSTSRLSLWGSGDTLAVQFRFESGMTGSLSTILVTPMCIRFQVFGSKAWVEARSDIHPGQDGITTLTIARSGEAKQVFELQYEDTVVRNLEAFAMAVEKRAPYPFTRAEKLGNVAVMEAIVKSAGSRSPAIP